MFFFFCFCSILSINKGERRCGGRGGEGAGGGTNYPFFILNNKLTYKFFANISIIVLSEVRFVT